MVHTPVRRAPTDRAGDATDPSLLPADDRVVIELDRRLSAVGVRDVVHADRLSRALYSSDASLYRVVPQAVARPRSIEQLHTVLDIARDLDLPVTTRGAGTSCAGNAVGPGLVVDVSRHLNSITSVDPQREQAVVEPGVVQAALQRAVAPYGLRFGPDPSTHTRCTIGGMIGNNACGPRALGYGKTADNVLGLEVITGGGETLRLDAGTRPGDAPVLQQLHDLVMADLGVVRTQFGRFGRQVSGYSMEHLLPENRFSVHRFFAGTEGTLGVITSATVRLVRDSPHKIMIALGYPTMPEAADAAPAVLAHRPVACEGLDRRIVDVVARSRGPAAVPPLPRGDGWMFVELVGDDPAAVRRRADALLADAGCFDGWVVDSPAAADALWKIREDGAGLAGISLDNPAYPGWEDSAVPPERLGAYLRDLDALLASYGLQGMPYGHFGDGCVHLRIDFPLTSAGGSDRYRQFVTAAAELVAGYGGSMSGEHGDGRARSALLPAMYSAEALRLFGAVKSIFDPGNLLNPGVLVDPRPVDADLRAPALRHPLPVTSRRHGRTRAGVVDPEFVTEVHQCSGVGKCLANNTPGLGVMCPSFQATREEKDSTRGRARVLQEMINGDLVSGGWTSPEVHEALDLCLSCKGCARDCPTGIDMAAYKARVLDETYRGRLRPRSHYTLGWLPRWGRMITKAPGLARLVNLTMSLPGLRRVVKWTAGVDQRRQLPRFATRAASATAARRIAAAGPAAAGPGSRGPVLVWVDSFSDCFAGGAVDALLRVLTAAGYQPEFPDRPACCGLTWISTGQLDGARKQIRASLDVLHPYAAQGIPIVGLEPSCLAVWRSDAPELVSDPRMAIVAGQIMTLAELLTATPDWVPPDLSELEIVAQPHCHHASVIGWAADAELLRRTGATIQTVGGCCGLAGNFGVELGHYDVSVQVAQHDLLPALETASPDAVVLADGFSCRTQLAELADRQAISLAQLLDR